MTDKKDIKRYLANLKSENDAIVLYTSLAEAETNPDLKKIYTRLTETEKEHAVFWTEKLKEAGAKAPPFKPSLQTRFFGWLAGKAGPGSVIPALASIEKNAASQYDGQEDANLEKMPADERSHARVFGYLARLTGGLKGSELAKFEGRHRLGGGNSLRAAVLGANDGLVSIFCLVMGVAGAGMDTLHILLTGVAGLLAGALSMALGEWLSVQNSREFYKHQIDVEKSELAEVPDEEKEELALIYQAKGLEESAALKLAGHIISDPATALDTLSREELGIDPEELGGSSWYAAITSFLLFLGGGILPVFPFIIFTGLTGIIVSASLSACGLFIIGSLITLLTGRPLILSGVRQVLFGVATAAATFGIGSIIGINLNR
jgi:VIT1/CCC1 family predicted Fe2+/Mn2+ transporter